MALSALEKAQNKAANKVRDAAHAARRRELKKAVEAAEQHPDVQGAHKELELAQAAMDAAMQAQKAREAELRAQIEAIQREIAGLGVALGIPQLNADRRAKGDHWLCVKKHHVERAEELFPDMQGAAHFSAAAWEPPAEVLAAMAEARRTAKA